MSQDRPTPGEPHFHRRLVLPPRNNDNPSQATSDSAGNVAPESILPSSDGTMGTSSGASQTTGTLGESQPLDKFSTNMPSTTSTLVIVTNNDALATQATPIRSTRRQSNMANLDNLTALLEEITSINTKLTEDGEIQMEHQAAYMACMADMDLSISKTTTLLSKLMAHLTKLQSNMELALSNVHSELTSLGDTMDGVKANLATVMDTTTEATAPAPTTTSDIPTIFANTEAAVLDQLRDFESDLGSTLDSTLPASRARTRSSTTAAHHTQQGHPSQDTTRSIHTVHSTPGDASCSDRDDDIDLELNTPAHNPWWPHVDPSRFGENRQSSSAPANTPAGTNRWTGVDPSRFIGNRRTSSVANSDAECAPATTTNTSPNSNPYLGSHVRCCHHRDGSFDEDMSPRFKPVPSPSQRSLLTRILSPDILAWHAGKVDADPLAGITLMEPEDACTLGISLKHATLVSEEHLEMVEHWNNNHWISQDTLHYGKGSYTPPSLSGPHLQASGDVGQTE